MDPSGLAHPAELLEREHELARVRAALSAVGRRAGGTLVIEGAAGMGKSRLLEAARSTAPTTAPRAPSAARSGGDPGYPWHHGL
jgi:hypothetical protein